MISSPLLAHARPIQRNTDLLVVGESPQQIAEWLADHLMLLGESILQKKDWWSIALPGGSTPQHLFRELALRKERALWKRSHLFWTDERAVAPTEPLSNYRMAMDNGLEELLLPSEQIHRIYGELPPAIAAVEYERELTTLCGAEGSLNAIVLGMGSDGHIASLFPNSSALKENSRLAIASYVPSQAMWRITLSFTALLKAPHLFILVTGHEKAETLGRLFGDGERYHYPVERLAGPNQQLIWCLDRTAAEMIAV